MDNTHSCIYSVCLRVSVLIRLVPDVKDTSEKETEYSLLEVYKRVEERENKEVNRKEMYTVTSVSDKLSEVK